MELVGLLVLQQGDDVEGDGAQAPQRLLPLGQLRRVRSPTRPTLLLPAPEQRAAHRGVLAGGAHVHEGVVVGLLGEGRARLHERVAGGGVLAGAGAEEGAVRLRGGRGVAGVAEEGGRAGGVVCGGGHGDGAEARDVGGGAGGVGGERGDAEVVEAGGVARRLHQQRGLAMLLGVLLLWFRGEGEGEGGGGVGEAEEQAELDGEQQEKNRGNPCCCHCRRRRIACSDPVLPFLNLTMETDWCLVRKRRYSMRVRCACPTVRGYGQDCAKLLAAVFGCRLVSRATVGPASKRTRKTQSTDVPSHTLVTSDI
jgi:hypothetical protein